MADCTSNIGYMTKSSQCALSDRIKQKEIDNLFLIAPNPFPEGRIKQEKVWSDIWSDHAKRLIWC